MSSKATATFYIHDYETFGKSPSLDRPAQFAGVRTDMDFNIIEEPLVIYCAPADDYLPEPEAVMITGITPQVARAKGVNEAEFTRQIHQAFSVAGTCILGYNNIRFDDEVSRNIFYRNFYDPYAYSWQNGNSRWDLLDVMRACYALRPDGIVWPENEDGFPSFRLEHLTRANGVEHTQAHDAMSDVYATIAMAKLVKQAQPRLFDFLLQHRNKHKLNALIDVADMTPLVHVSGMFGAARGNTSWVSPLAWHPDNKNAVIMCDLAGDMTPLLTLSAEQLRERLYTRRDDLAPDQAPVPIAGTHQQMPGAGAGQNPAAGERRAAGHRSPGLPAEPAAAETAPGSARESGGAVRRSRAVQRLRRRRRPVVRRFFSDADKAAMRIIQQTKPQNLPALDLAFSDGRMKELLFRFRARNYPNTLDDAEQRRWLQHRQEALSAERVQSYLLQLESLYNLHEGDKEKTALLKALFDYGKELVG